MEKEGTRERSSEVVGLLAGGLAHDYNNMLTTMLGGMDLILCDDIPATAREAAEDVKATMLKAAALVKRMLSCATGAETQPEPLDLGEAVTDVVRIMRRAIPDNVVVDYRKPAALPKVMADAAMVWQVVMNLVLNACDAIGSAGGVVKISVQAVDAGNGACRVEIVVADNGCGMDEATKARIFEPLFTTKPHGNGLGLASVRSVMEALHGEVLMESELGKGTTFRLLFPVEGSQPSTPNPESPTPKPESQAPNPEPQTLTTECPTPCQQSGEGASTVLVVDDDAAIVKLLKIILGKAGYSVATAQSGEEGLDVYHAAGGRFGVCLIDASMGAGMSGLDLCAAIRAEAPSLPLILMSAYRAKEMNDRMASSGVTTFLAKPFRGGDVIALCAKYSGGAQ